MDEIGDESTHGEGMQLKVPDGVRLESRPCPLCLVYNDELVLVDGDMLYNLPGEYRVVRCKLCGLMRTDPRPTSDTIGYYYPSHYGPYVNTVIEQNVGEDNFKKTWKTRIKQYIQFHTNSCPDLPPGRMLEIGSASGAFLHQMASRGWEVEGIERSETASRNTQELGYSVFPGTVEDAPDPIRSYDMIVGWMVFEHLHHPVEVLQKCYQWTVPDGWLILSVPNWTALEFKLFKQYLYSLHLPCHLYHYTPRSLGRMLKKGRWQVKKIFHQRTLSNFIGSMGCRLRAKGRWPEIANKLMKFPERGGVAPYMLYPLALLLSSCGQTGRMTVWAKKHH